MSGNRANQTLAEFTAQVLVHEGAWVIEPALDHNDSIVTRILERLRFVPTRISSPSGENRYAFAERGAEGRWFFVWVPKSRER